MTRSLRVRFLAPDGRIAVAVVLAVGLVVAFGRAPIAVAADPSGSPSSGASSPACGDSLEAWLDGPLPPDIPAGAQVPIGVTVWDCRGDQLAPVDGAEVRVHPKTGKAKPATFPTRSDWPGHLTATIEIPKGGLGAIEAGVQGRVCHDNGACEDGFFPFTTGGVGPPPAAPRGLLVNSVITPQTDRIVASQPFRVEITLEPKADWGLDALALPDRIFLEADLVRGNESVMADATRAAGSSGTYSATMGVDRAGQYLLHVAVPSAGDGMDFAEGETVVILVEPGDRADSARPSAPAPSSEAPGPETPPFLPIAVGLVGILAAGLVIRRVFADL
jgi:hypothetical protein